MSIETHEHIRRALLEIFNYKTVLSFQSIVSGLQEIARMSSPKKDIKTRLLVNAAALAVSAPVKDLRSVIDQVAVRVHGLYVLKTAGNPALDPLRNVVISLYREREPNVKLRRKEIKQAAQLCLKMDISDYEYYQACLGNNIHSVTKQLFKLNCGFFIFSFVLLLLNINIIIIISSKKRRKFKKNQEGEKKENKREIYKKRRDFIL
ncbi:hypothetical protein IEQ34_022646 [Dendrobium chrysotoxum]|uniref:Uncharacterized protein n=1 Tax=Dendrobium chrysotoxum TaxID=161865 RepID=A0AAV7FXP6_DENCH|nr:hypothetical protein IEQ34_022646 [Dendrobium chrysotoxum]